VEAARAAFGPQAPTIVGGAALTRRYAAALPGARIVAGEDAASRGLWRIAREAGLLA